jgi:hypothetical protein
MVTVFTLFGSPWSYRWGTNVPPATGNKKPAEAGCLLSRGKSLGGRGLRSCSSRLGRGGRSGLGRGRSDGCSSGWLLALGHTDTDGQANGQNNHGDQNGPHHSLIVILSA